MFLATNVDAAADARADVVMAKEGLKVKLALLMQQSNEPTVNAQERHAYASDEYRKYLEETLKPAVRNDHHNELKRKAAEATIDAWRTQEASIRATGKIG